MARIRTIKPEFPQSESIGRLSRDARLLYIMLFTIVDDAGRARASSRMLASLLYPYDDDAGSLMDKWLAELERGQHVRRYEVDGSQYLEIVKWLEHQKIDKPSRSRLPAFVDGSRIVAKPREGSATDLGPSTGTLDLGSVVVVVEDARAREPAKPLSEKVEVSPEKRAAVALGLAFLNAAGFEDHGDLGIPMSWQNWPRVTDRAVKWIDAGWSEQMIVAETKRAVASRTAAGDGMPTSVNFFETVFATAHARAARPLPIVNVLPAETRDVARQATSPNRNVGDALAALTRRLEQDDGTAGHSGGDRLVKMLAQG